MPGVEVLRAAGGIELQVTIQPDQECYTFGDVVSGKVLITLNKPIFFVEDGIIQLSLEGKEIFQIEETAKESLPVHSQSHIDKFFREKFVMFD